MNCAQRADDHASRSALREGEAPGRPVTEDTLAAQRLRALHDAAVQCRLEGRYTEAEALFRSLVIVTERRLGPNAAPLVDLLVGHAITLRSLGGLDEAVAGYVRALRIATAELGEASSSVAGIWHDLGGIEHERGNCAAAEEFARRAVLVRTQATDATEVEVAADKAA